MDWKFLILLLLAAVVACTLVLADAQRSGELPDVSQLEGGHPGWAPWPLSVVHSQILGAASVLDEIR